MSATLTDDISHANLCAHGAVMNDGQSYPVVLIFSIPKKEIVNEGTVGAGHVTEGFSTKHLVKDPRQLLEGFLKNLGITVEQVIQDYAKRKVEFYRIPHDYLINTDLLD